MPKIHQNYCRKIKRKRRRRNSLCLGMLKALSKRLKGDGMVMKLCPKGSKCDEIFVQKA
jgi:hypothetical protein